MRERIRRVGVVVLAVALQLAVPPSTAGEWLPSAHLFEPLLAAPNEPRFFTSFRQYDAPSVDDQAYAFGAGEVLPLYQFDTAPDTTQWQTAVDGGVMGLLDIESKSDALVNADYQIGARLAWQRQHWSGRIRLYHQSSHLGDDYLVYRAVRYAEFSYESIEAIAAFRNGHWRLYGGGEYLWNRFPKDLEPLLLRAGYERYGNERLPSGALPFVAMDVRAWGERDWEPAVSGLTGLEFDNHDSGRYLRLFIEGHAGYSPHGQFFVEDARWLGVGIQFGL